MLLEYLCGTVRLSEYVCDTDVSHTVLMSVSGPSRPCSLRCPSLALAAVVSAVPVSVCVCVLV